LFAVQLHNSDVIVNTFTEAINIHVTIATLYEPRSTELRMSYCIYM